MNERMQRLTTTMIQLYSECWEMSSQDGSKSIAVNGSDFEIVSNPDKNQRVLFTLNPGIPNYNFEHERVTLESLFNKFSNENEYRRFRAMLTESIDLDSITNEYGRIIINDDVFAFLGALYPQIVIDFYQHLRQSMVITSLKEVCEKLTANI
ncbi:hypothetical protein [Latilactobacillus sakei]|uniref:hypothetical protein n=1 Tax=Latilactobacillus sakei TaxID=1599 RepID=UPI00202EC4CD|nr:hypothetical protein [Latilactobacillus sakei]MCM1636281.1 hypothetical protein [Latilactobacillus sakei]